MGKHLNPLEKEFLIRQYKSNPTVKLRDFCESVCVSDTAFKKWLKQYDECGIEGLARADAEIKEILPEGVDRTEEAYKKEILKLRIENERLKKLYSTDERGWGTGVCSLKAEEFEIVELLARDYDVQDICSLMGVSRSGYYKWKKRDKSDRDIKREEMIALVEAVHADHRTHGYRWTAAYIRLEYGYECSDNYIYKCFRYLGIKSETKHQVHYRKRKEKDRYPNLIFSTWETVDRPRQVIVSDMTAFKFWISYFEVTFYFDAFTKEILTYRVARRKGDRNQYLDGLEDVKKLLKGQTEPVVLHTDQGSVYASMAYNEIIKDTVIVRSMSRAGKPTDNPVNESLNGWMKEELYMDFKISESRGRDEFIAVLDEYVNFYNKHRPCYALGYDTPVNYRKRYFKGELERKNTFENRVLSEEPKFVQKRRKQAHSEDVSTFEKENG